MERANTNRMATLLVVPMLCGASALAQSTCDDWAQVETGGPGQRQNHDMAYDGQNIVMYAGQSGGVNYDDCWVWDGVRWSLTDARTPGPRNVHKMAYHAATDRVILFGGSNGGALGDTWAWDGFAQNWTELSPTFAPDPRFNHAMAYDAARGEVVLFGGFGAIRYNDTWVFDGEQWEQKFPATSPPGRNGHAMAYDPVRERIVIFGGFSGPRRNDTWEWDGSDWVEVAIAGPSGRQYTNMDWDPSRQAIILAGGQTGPGTLDRVSDTWAYDGTSWTPLLASDFGARDQHCVEYYPDAEQLVLHGGYGGALGGGGTGVLADTWAWACDEGCRADLDGDGSLTLFDFLMFQNLFDAGDLEADFDGDGALTLFDFLTFQNEFDAGCE